MIEFVTRNLGWKLLSLAVAFLFWLNIAREPDLATIISVPVEYNNFPAGLEISSKIVESIYVEARGPAGQLRNLQDSRIAAVIDFSTVDAPGERTFTLTSRQLNLPRGITLIRTIPAQLRFTFEKKLTREVSVNVKFSGTLPPGLSVADVEVEPRELSITGPESRVRESKELVSDPFDLTGVTGDAQHTLGVYEAEPEVRILDAPQVTVKIHVQHKP
jgi:YbbR domain-containing protein